MKLRCNDGIVRDFQPCVEDNCWGLLSSYCKECDYNFDVHDTWVLKPRWKAHICSTNTNHEERFINGIRIDKY